MNFNNVVFEVAFGTSEQLIESTVPEICFSGRSNVGKSSLINKTLGRKSLARVSTKPGKTVTINFYKLDNLRIVDLPGYGYAKVNFDERKRWSDLMESYFRTNRNIPIVFQLIDMRHSATEFDISMLEFLRHYNINYCVLLTKSDKLNKTEYNSRLQKITEELGEYADGVQIIPTSAATGEGIEKIKQIIENITNESNRKFCKE